MALLILGPRTDVLEDYMELYCRLFYILIFLGLHSARSRRKNILYADKPFEPKPIKPENIPQWMQNKRISEQDVLHDQAHDKARLQPKNFQIRWDEKLDDAPARAYIEMNRLEVKIQRTQTAASDPRSLAGDEFRDSVRY